MTRKDYESLAAVLKAEFTNARDNYSGPMRSARMSAVSQVARAIAENLAASNKAFSVQLFLYNAGVTA